jgi:predicted RND superfamily exporter protein
MVAIIPLIIGLGVDYSVYVSKRYQEELQNGKDITSAMQKAIGSVGIAMFLAIITTIIAFMSNISSEIIPIREFGLVCGLGIFYAFILTLTFHTSLRWLIDVKSTRKPALKKEKELYLIDLGTSTASRSVMYYPALIMIIVILVTIGGVLFGMNVRTEFSDRDFLPSEWDSIQTQRKLEQEFNGSSFSQAYVLLELEDSSGIVLDDDLVSVDTLRGLEAIEESISDDRFVVRVNGTPRIESILDHVQSAIKNNQTLANMVDQDEDLFPDTDDDVRLVFDHLFDQLEADQANSSRGDGLGAILLRSRVDKVLYRDDAGLYRATVVRVYVNVEESDDVRTMYNDLRSDAKAAEFLGMKKTVTGNPIQTITTMDSLQESQIYSTIISMICAMVILIIIYCNFILGIIAMTPVLISSIWILGTMYILGISINVFTVSITALTIGLGIDYAIHIIERYREECKSHDTTTAIQRTIRSTGTALFISALTTVCGFIVLLISPIPPIQHFGIITGMTIIYSSILAVVVIPILLMRWAKNKN